MQGCDFYLPSCWKELRQINEQENDLNIVSSTLMPNADVLNNWAQEVIFKYI
jgi:hypothetical protein